MEIEAIFPLNPGRSGSKYLSTLLSTASGCQSFHEGFPNGFGRPLRRFNLGMSTLMEQVAQEKRAQIHSASQQGLVFSDTSHCFGKGFGWPLMKLIDQNNVAIIIIKRNPEEVAKSLFRIRCVPLNHIGPKYILMPNRKSALKNPPSFCHLPAGVGYKFAKVLSVLYRGVRRGYAFFRPEVNRSEPFADYQKKCVRWYVNEMEALAQKFKEVHPDCRYYEVSIDDLNRPEVVMDLFKFCGLEPSSRTYDVIGKPVNLKLTS